MIQMGSGTYFSIVIPERYMGLTAIYKPLTALDWKLNRYGVTFEPPSKFKFTIGYEF